MAGDPKAQYLIEGGKGRDGKTVYALFPLLYLQEMKHGIKGVVFLVKLIWLVLQYSTENECLLSAFHSERSKGKVWVGKKILRSGHEAHMHDLRTNEILFSRGRIPGALQNATCSIDPE